MKKSYLITMSLFCASILSLKAQTYTVETVAGSTTFGFADGTGLAARFRNPDGVLINKDGDIIITDRTNHSIRKMTPAGVVTTFAGTGAAGYEEGKPGRFNFPWQSTIDAAGNIIVVEKDGARIRKITPDGTVSTIAGTGSSGFQDGVVTSARFDQALDGAFDSEGNLYIADRNNRRVRKITPGAGGDWATAMVSTIAGNGTTTGTVVWPISLTIDSEDNIFVSDSRTIKKITKVGEVTTIAGLQSSTTFSDGEPGQPLTARLGDVFGLNFDNQGNIIFADATYHRIRKITPGVGGDWTTATVTTIAGTGSTGRQDGLGNAATFNQPYDVVMDANGNIYVADNINNSIRKLIPSSLPVHLISFNAVQQNNGIKLDWSTASESNNSHFEILRSSNANDFVSLGTVNGNNNSNSVLNYTFIDDKPLEGINYYKLKQEDFDGKTSFSNVISVKFGLEDKNTLTVYYNSKEGKLILNTGSKTDKNSVVKVLTIDGKVVFSASVENSVIELPLSLQKGIYVVTLNGGDNSSSLKFIAE